MSLRPSLLAMAGVAIAMCTGSQSAQAGQIFGWSVFTLPKYNGCELVFTLSNNIDKLTVETLSGQFELEMSGSSSIHAYRFEFIDAGKKRDFKTYVDRPCADNFQVTIRSVGTCLMDGSYYSDCGDHFYQIYGNVGMKIRK
jgi:hypothetical protein